MTEAQFDCTKPFRTRDGREVTKFKRRMDGWFEGWVICYTRWRPDGRRWKDAGETGLDLVNVPEEPPRPAGIPAADVREAQNDGDPIRRAATGPGDAADRLGQMLKASWRLMASWEREAQLPKTMECALSRFEDTFMAIEYSSPVPPQPPRGGVSDEEVEAAMNAYAYCIATERKAFSYYMRAALEAARAVESQPVAPMQDDVSEAEVLNAFNMVFDLHKTNIVEWGDMRAVLTAFLASRTKGAGG